MEFWYGVLFSTFLFVLGTIISIFASDVRSYVITWQKDRALRGKALQLKKLKRDLEIHEQLVADPGSVAAFFWSGLYLIISVAMLIAFMGFVVTHAPDGWAKKSGEIMITVSCSVCYLAASFLFRKACTLINPSEQSAKLQSKIKALEASSDP
jgi:hypothetical protein